MSDPAGAEDRSELARLLEARRDDVWKAWAARVREDPAIPKANALSEPALRDRIPELFDEILGRLRADLNIRVAESVGRYTGHGQASQAHAEERFEQNYSLESAMREWGHFRATLFEVVASEDYLPTAAETQLIHAAIDEAMTRVAVTMHFRARQQFARRTAELEALIDGVPDGVLVGGADGIARANPQALALLGVSDVSELMRPLAAVAETLQLRDAATCRPIPPENTGITRALSGERSVMEVLIRNPQLGKDVCLRVATAPIWVGDQIIGVVAVITDITEQRERESRLSDQVRFRERFIAILGHDLRNPLSSIMTGAGSLLRQQNLTETHERVLQRIVTSSRRMGRMIENLLDLTRSRLGGGIPIHPVACDLAKVVGQVVDELEASNPDRKLIFDAPGDNNGVWDPDRMAQVVSNLISNALTYGSPGTAIEIALRSSDTGVSLSVTNQGVPIPEADIPRLFDPFRVADEESRKASRGLGLGLYIVHELVRAHHGVIEVKSTEAATVFGVLLPRDSRLESALEADPGSAAS